VLSQLLVDSLTEAVNAAKTVATVAPGQYEVVYTLESD
jgi:hypothetical protein